MLFEYIVSKLTKENSVIKFELFEVLKKMNTEIINKESLITLNNDIIFNLN